MVDTAAKAKETESAAVAGAAPIRLGSRFRILPASRLRAFESGPAVAVVAEDELAPDDSFFAKICAPDTVPRIEAMEKLKHMHETSVLRPIEWGPVRWPGAARPRLAVVFRRPADGPMMKSLGGKIPRFSAEDIARRVLGPAVLTLAYMSQRGLTHRAVRPDNIFYVGEGHSSIILGDCVTAPPAATQPVLFETIESGMTPPLGRGPGTVADDYYSLGVTLLILAMGCCPIRGMKDRDIIEAKLQKGSYSALMGGERPPFGMRELLRGLLSDDPVERWGLEQLEQWLGGGLRSSVQEVRAVAADRPFRFLGGEYNTCRSLADVFGRNWEKARKVVEDPSFDKWLRRGASNPLIADRVQAVLDLEGGDAKGGKADAKLVCRVCAVLDRAGPIRYRGLIAYPTALGSMLAAAFLKNDGKRIEVIRDCIASGVALEWYMSQTSRVQMIYDAQIDLIKMMQKLLRHTGPGYGVERVLYMLNPVYPCQSEIVAGHYVQSLRDLLPTLEKIVEKKGGLPKLVDRHLAAFVASRIKGSIDRLLATLEGRHRDPLVVKLGMLALLARIQADHGPEGLPFLTEWLAGELEGATERIKNRTVREELKKRVAKVAGSGDLVKLNSYLNNETMLRRDEGERRQAALEYKAAGREIAQLESKEFQDSAQRAGWRIAAGISGAVAAAAMVTVALS